MTASASASAPASAPASTSAAASASAPATADVDLAMLQAKYCAKPSFEACKLLDAFAKAAPLADSPNRDNLYFGWGHELGRKADGEKSMVVLRVRTNDAGKTAKGGLYVPADAKATKTTTDLVESLRAGGKAEGEAKGFLIFLRTNPGPDAFRPLVGTSGASSTFGAATGFKSWVRQDTSAKGVRLLVVSWASGDVLDGPHQAELRVSEVWELHAEK